MSVPTGLALDEARVTKLGDADLERRGAPAAVDVDESFGLAITLIHPRCLNVGLP